SARFAARLSCSVTGAGALFDDTDVLAVGDVAFVWLLFAVDCVGFVATAESAMEAVKASIGMMRVSGG
ncbi:hypothetical protein OFD71_38245, partial [Escherichia coli]|nr:hypothetical protein [Escherichia coli]